MNILGISCNYHDASAALIVNGKVVASSAEERFTYEKHDPSFPSHSIAFCLEQANIKSGDIDLVVFHEDPIVKFTRSLASAFKNYPFSLMPFLKTAKDNIVSGFWIKNEISKALDISPSKISFSPHHMSHAAHAFLTSGLDEAAIMTIDAVGEWCSSCIFKGSKKNGQFSIEPLDIVPFPNSLGLVYSAFTGFLGFKVNDGECSTMALAAFGKPIYESEVKKIIQLQSDGTYKVDVSYFDFSSDERLPMTDKFIQLFGLPRSKDTALQFNSMLDLNISDAEQMRFAHVAASVQKVFEDAVQAYAERAFNLTGMKNLCYAGGGALNCVANSKIVEKNLFENIYIPPDPGDGGGAMGAALYGAMVKSKDSIAQEKISAYLGQNCRANEDFKRFLKDISPTQWHLYSNLGLSALKPEEIEVKEYKSDDDLIEVVVGYLMDKKIVGWCQDRFENGPRALGNRSILCRPDCIETAEYLSRKIKLRSSYRPYACSIDQTDADNILDITSEPKLANWMQSSFKVRENQFAKIRAACHVDKTTRAQVVNATENAKYSKLLQEFKKKFGVAALLNTSFNMQGYPLVSGPYEALLMFAVTHLEIIVIDNLIIRKTKS